VISGATVVAGPGHTAVIAALHALCFTDAWNEAAVAALMAVPGVFGLLADDPTGPVGFILCRVAADECEVLAIGTHPNHRRTGIGQALLDAALRRASGVGVRRAFLEVAADDTGAQRFYDTAGFAPIGCRPGYYRRGSGVAMDAVVMARTLEGTDRG